MSKSFLQSSEWASFQKSLGRKVFWVENKLIIKYPLPMGLSFLYAPRVGFSLEKTFKLFLHKTKKIAKLENAIFVRIEPDLIENFNIENSLEIIRLGSSKTRRENLEFKIGFSVQPTDTLILGLKKPEKEILSEMHSKTRYNIHLAEKHKVKIVKTIDPKDINIFYNLALGTSRRDGFSYHEREYYKKMLETLGPSGMVKLYIAYIKNPKPEIINSKQIQNPKFKIQNNLTPRLRSGQAIQQFNNSTMMPVAANLMLFYQDTVIYLHGASDHSQRKFMAPYLLQWQAIKDAKKGGYRYYDFWGISPHNNEENSNPKTQISNKFQNPKSKLEIRNWELEISKKHPWAGITRFKKGFAPLGNIIHYSECRELIFQPFWYKLYKLVRKIRN